MSGTFASVWSVAGPLVGIFIGSGLTLRIQDSQWRKEQDRREYVELLNTLFECQRLIIRLTPPGGVSVRTGKEQEDYFDARLRAAHAIQTRLFIHQAMLDNNVMENWNKVEAALDSSDPTLVKFTTAFKELIASIRAGARGDLGTR